MMFELILSDDTPIYTELALETWYYTSKCEHGLSLWLCEGPNHYPADNPWDEPPF